MRHSLLTRSITDLTLHLHRTLMQLLLPRITLWNRVWKCFVISYWVVWIHWFNTVTVHLLTVWHTYHFRLLKMINFKLNNLFMLLAVSHCRSNRFMISTILIICFLSLKLGLLVINVRLIISLLHPVIVCGLQL